MFLSTTLCTYSTEVKFGGEDKQAGIAACTPSFLHSFDAACARFYAERDASGGVSGFTSGAFTTHSCPS